MIQLHERLKNAEPQSREWQIVCREVFEKYYRNMTLMASRSLPRHIAKEVASTALYKAMVNIDKFNPTNPEDDGTDFAAWIFMITSRCLLDAIEIELRHRDYIEDIVINGDFEQLDDTHADWEKILGDAEVLIGVREMAMLLDYSELGGAESSLKYKVSIDAMKKKIERIRRKLRPWLMNELLQD